MSLNRTLKTTRPFSIISIVQLPLSRQTV